ncbi:MAG: penicillin acylase family protein [Nocardioides sp.]|nr:penicillin acylase family protein [Nocardioides sp.]MDP3891727.1 penicillin acylase family protein [Nocardioides sp.]
MAVVATVGALLQRPLPQTDGEIEVPGLSAAVEVLRDDHGVPQIYADTLDDLLRAQGFVHAQERFYEMDVRRHATAGRLAELFGEEAVDSDRFVRTMGWRRVAEQELALVSPATRAALDAYAAGVNAWIDQSSTTDRAVEYTLLRATGLEYHPEPWTPVDSLAWLKAMAWDLRGNMEEEIDRAILSAQLPEHRVEELYPEYPYDEHAPIVSGGAVVDGTFEPGATAPGTRNPRRPAYTADQTTTLAQLRDGLERLPALLGRGEGLGSNSWVVGGERSSTGAPLLANDPHLGIGMPGVWMQMGLHCRRVSDACPLDVAGFTFSGTPGVIIGHNADIAWGFTNLGPDVTDLYLEQVREEQWRYDGDWRDLDVRRETIEVRDGDDIELTIRSTDHGPLLSDVSDELTDVGASAPAPGDAVRRGSGYAVALSWTALQPAPTADAILALNQARDFEEFRAAAADFTVPAQNLVYADREGHIGYQAPGRVPIRKSGNDGRWPAAGWLPQNDWSGEFVPFDGLPWVLDPEEGFLVTANQAVTPASYSYFLTEDWDRGYRSERIRDLLLEEGELSVAKMVELQSDDLNPMASTLVPYLLDVFLERPYHRGGQELLRDWDFRQPADSAAAAYYNVVWRLLLEHTFHDDLPEGHRPDGGQRWFAVVSELLADPGNWWWDDRTTEETVETRDDILRRALLEARDELTRRQSVDPDDWEWGRLHRMDLRNSTLGGSGIGLVERLVNRDGYAASGGGAIVNATNWDAAEGYEVTSAASMRMVVSLGDLDRSRWVNLTGVSGHPASGHYADQTDLWVEGETLPWPFTRDAVEAAAEDTLTLVPTPD